MKLSETAQFYDENYYASGCGPVYQRDAHWMTFFGGIAQKMVEGIQPGTVLDAGCAMGFLVEQLRGRGVEAWGVDISAYAIEQAHERIRAFVWVGSVTEPFPNRYDLIVSIEVLEHLPKEAAEQAVVNFCRHADDVLFSSTPLDYKEATHFNVQPVEYWAELFARQGFFRDVDFDATFITPWAARYRRKQEILPRMVRDYERWGWAMRKENADLREQVVAYELRMKHMAGEMEKLRAKAPDLAALEAQVASWQEQQNTAGWKILQKIRQVVNPVRRWLNK
jgi:hypothetical protein